ncbi:GlxA family transcriptional regulator [Undibacterium sp. TJN25]|uniref:GlxA family transcriptional regulator n=1 Tax=Undibacterium sp. TJN25 TaxID=3413056 RepID=UPI003BF02E27
MKRIGFIVFPGFQILDTVAVAVFELANMLAPQPVYQIDTLSEHGGTVISSSGMKVDTEPFGDAAFDTAMVAGGMTLEPQSKGLHDFLNRALLVSRRTASICTGAFVLAEAGILDGRRATTHWYHARELQKRFPKVKVDEDRIFIVDGSVWTSAGMTACIDLCLAMVEEDLGVEMSRSVAKKMVVYHRRSGGQSQYSALLELSPKSDRIQTSLVYAKENLRKGLSVEELAEVAHLSPRQFSRAFAEETGQTPAKAIENLRVEAARNMIEEGRHTIDVVATETGFGDPERMRRAFLRAFGQPPQSIKRAARSLAAA